VTAGRWKRCPVISYLAIIRLDDPKALASEKYCNVGRRVEVRFADLGTAQAATAIKPASSIHVE
jgi:hypothetical protein